MFQVGAPLSHVSGYVSHVSGYVSHVSGYVSHVQAGGQEPLHLPPLCTVLGFVLHHVYCVSKLCCYTICTWVSP
jgi:hypothetical protein